MHALTSKGEHVSSCPADFHPSPANPEQPTPANLILLRFTQNHPAACWRCLPTCTASCWPSSHWTCKRHWQRRRPRGPRHWRRPRRSARRCSCRCGSCYAFTGWVCSKQACGTLQLQLQLLNMCRAVLLKPPRPPPDLPAAVPYRAPPSHLSRPQPAVIPPAPDAASGGHSVLWFKLLLIGLACFSHSNT